jgi:hypothetical protein
MRLMSAAENLTNPVREFVGAEQPLGFYNLALAMDPLELDRVEPWTLFRQQTGNDAH